MNSPDLDVKIAVEIIKLTLPEMIPLKEINKQINFRMLQTSGIKRAQDKDVRQRTNN